MTIPEIIALQRALAAYCSTPKQAAELFAVVMDFVYQCEMEGRNDVQGA